MGCNAGWKEESCVVTLVLVTYQKTCSVTGRILLSLSSHWPLCSRQGVKHPNIRNLHFRSGRLLTPGRVCHFRLRLLWFMYAEKPPQHSSPRGSSVGRLLRRQSCSTAAADGGADGMLQPCHPGSFLRQKDKACFKEKKRHQVLIRHSR